MSHKTLPMECDSSAYISQQLEPKPFFFPQHAEALKYGTLIKALSTLKNLNEVKKKIGEFRRVRVLIVLIKQHSCGKPGQHLKFGMFHGLLTH